MKVQLEGVAETLLIPLWARAHETQKNKNRLLNDPHAIEMIQQIDYDFSKFKKAKGSQIGVAVRSNILDNETLAFIKKHPDALIINLAAGLDTRFYRVNNEHIYWVNIDLPEVIALRQQILPKEPENMQNIGLSMFDPIWIEQITSHKNRPVLFIMEGASMYFKEKELHDLCELIVTHFPNSFMLMETSTPFIIKNQQFHDAISKEKTPFHWAITKGKEITKLHPSIRYIKEQTLYEGYRSYWGILGLLSLIPWWNNNCNDKIVYIQFKA